MSSCQVYDLTMKSAASKPVDAIANERREQLRRAKRAQRARERKAGLVIVPVRLNSADAERLRVALREDGFEQRLRELLDDELIDVAHYENLAALCWNRKAKYLPAREALGVYERNWRHVDVKRMRPEERALVDRLAARFGNGVLNV